MPQQHSSGRHPESKHRQTSGNRRPYQRSKHDSNKIASLIIVVIFLIIVLVCIMYMTRGLWKKSASSDSDSTSESSEDAADETEEVEEVEEEEEAAATMEGLEDVSTDSLFEIESYFTYGTHFFITGTMEVLPQIETMELVLRPVDQAVDLASWEMVCTTDGDTTTFMSAETITEGPQLDAFPEGEYAWLIKLTSSSGEVQYYIINDTTGSDAIEYYTITQNDSNNLVLIDTMTDEVHGMTYFGVTVTAAELPDDVYDFVVDPGHGGNDGGTTTADETYVEAEMVLECGEMVYDLLTAAGYKVLLTRDGTEGDDVWMAYNMYDEDGRVTITCASKAKYCISIHINSNDDSTVSGYQIYGTCRGNYEFAETIALNLNTYTTASASTMTSCYVSEGVYYNTYSGYLEEGLFDNVDILYMIREVGGIATGANQDGSSEEYNENIYRNSNVCVESCLVEIGFITNDTDLNNMINNMDSYAEAIAQSYISMAENIIILDMDDAVPAETTETDDTDTEETGSETDDDTADTETDTSDTSEDE